MGMELKFALKRKSPGGLGDRNPMNLADLTRRGAEVESIGVYL